MGDCPHGLGDPAWCGVCLNGPTRPEKAASRVGASMSARFDGWCSGCRDGVVRGQEIVPMSDESWRHVRCV